MKKFFDSFYLLSKFSLSFVLLLCIFFLIYLLYVNYQDQEKTSKIQLELENELRANINENLKFIKNLSNEILETKTTLINIEKVIEENSKNETVVDLTAINKSIDLLNKNFNSLSSDISSLQNKKKENLSKNNPELINQSIKEIIELIKIKYENNVNIDNELKYLETILGNDKTPVLEKLSILKNKKYKGHIFLENQFNDEVNLYLKSIMKENNNFLNKIILPYINLSPSSENTIIDEKILILDEIKFHIKNRNIAKAYYSMNKIEKYEIFFQVSSNEMKNYNSFIKALIEIK
tara:strand:+ start:51 stop:929 length:879 start_codon:yes stop_codon:yes gene_type:complete